MQPPLLLPLTSTMRFFYTPNGSAASLKWLAATSRWNVWLPILRRSPVSHCASRVEYRKMSRPEIQVFLLKCTRKPARSQLVTRRRNSKCLTCPYPRRGQVVAQENSEKSRSRGSYDESSLSFILSATDTPERNTVPQKPTKPNTEDLLAFNWEALHAQPADECAAHTAEEEILRMPDFSEVPDEEDDYPTEGLQARLSSKLERMETNLAVVSGSRKDLPMLQKSKFTGDRGDREAARVRPSGGAQQHDALLQFSHQTTKMRQKTLIGRSRLCSAAEGKADKITSGPNTGTERHRMYRIRDMLHAFGGNYAKWEIILGKGNPMNVVALYRLLAKCPAATKRWRGLLYVLNRSLLDRLRHFHIDDIATLMTSMKQVGHLRTDFLLAASSLIAANASRVSASSCCVLLDSYAALRFFVARSVDALCRALADPEKLSSMTVTHVAAAVGSLARLDIRSEYLLRALSTQFLNRWQLSPTQQALTKDAEKNFLLSSGVSPNAVNCEKERLCLNASALLSHLPREETLSSAASQPSITAVPSMATSPEVPFEAAPNDIALLLYGISKLQWHDPRLVLPLLQTGVPTCASRMHPHQLLVAAIALARLTQVPRSTPILKMESLNTFAGAAAAAPASRRAALASATARSAQDASCISDACAPNVGELLKKEATSALERVAYEACQRLPQFKAEVFCMFLGACATVPLRGNVLIPQLASHLPRSILTFRSEDIVLMMAALSRLNAHSASIIDIVISQVRQHLREYNSAAAQSLLEAFSSCGVIRADWQRLSSRLLKPLEIHPASLSRLFCAISNCGYNAPELLLPLFLAVEASVSVLTANELADIYAAAAFLGLQRHPLLRPHYASIYGALRSLIGDCRKAPSGCGSCQEGMSPISTPLSEARRATDVNGYIVDGRAVMHYDSAVNLALAYLICPGCECSTYRGRSDLRKRLARATEIVLLTEDIVQTLEREAKTAESRYLSCGLLTPLQLRTLALLCAAMVLVSRRRMIVHTELYFLAGMRRSLTLQAQRLLVTVHSLPCQPSAVPLCLTPSRRGARNTGLLVYRSRNVNARVSPCLTNTDACTDVRREKQSIPSSPARPTIPFQSCQKEPTTLRPDIPMYTDQQCRDTEESVRHLKASASHNSCERTSAHTEESHNCCMRPHLAYHSLLRDASESVTEQEKPRSFIEESCMTGLLAIKGVLEAFFHVHARLHAERSVGFNSRSHVVVANPTGDDRQGSAATASVEASVESYSEFADNLNYCNLSVPNPYSCFLVLEPWEIQRVVCGISNDRGMTASKGGLRVPRTSNRCIRGEASLDQQFPQIMRYVSLRRSTRQHMFQSRTASGIMQTTEGHGVDRRGTKSSLGAAIIWGDAAHFWHGTEKSEHQRPRRDACTTCYSVASKGSRNNTSFRYSHATAFQLCCFSDLQTPNQQRPRITATPAGGSKQGIFFLYPLLVPHSLWNALQTDALRAEYLSRSLAELA